MGAEIVCDAIIDGVAFSGKVLLETDDLIFRGLSRVVIALSKITCVTACGSRLIIEWGGRKAEFAIGAVAAEKWRDRIKSPPSLMSRMEIKAGMQAGIVGDIALELLNDLESAEVDVLPDFSETACDLLILSVSSISDLRQIFSLTRSLKPTGGLWIIYPKGRRECSESDVLTAGRAAGLKDVRVVRVSQTLTGLKFVIPLSARSQHVALKEPGSFYSSEIQTT